MTGSSTSQILVTGPAWVGDMVMSQSLYRFLAKTRPGVSIDVLAPAWTAPLLARMPEVRRAITSDQGHGQLALAARRRQGVALRKEGYEQAILLTNSWKSGLVPFFAGIPQRTGWRGEMRYGLLNDLRLLDESSLPQMVQRFVALGLPAGSALPAQLPRPELAVDAGQAAEAAARFAVSRDAPCLALCPGAEFGGAKRWPEEYYASIANRYLSKGWQVALYGSANDREVTHSIRRQCGDHPACIDLAGSTTLAEAIDLLSLSDLVLSNDSGLMHIAAALGRPVLVVYGATSPGFTPPLSERALTLVSDIECAPCFERECPLGHHRCMRDTLPEQVAVKLEHLMAGGDRP